jgi:hypothetical protein
MPHVQGSARCSDAPKGGRGVRLGHAVGQVGRVAGVDTAHRDVRLLEQLRWGRGSHVVPVERIDDDIEAAGRDDDLRRSIGSENDTADVVRNEWSVHHQRLIAGPHDGGSARRIGPGSTDGMQMPEGGAKGGGETGERQRCKRRDAAGLLAGW